MAPSPFTLPGRFRATFEGDINLRLRAFLIFSAEGKGKLTVTVGGKPALHLEGDLASKAGERIRLGKGKNHVVAIYEAPADGDASLRLFWSSNTFPAETVPPMVLTHDPDVAGLAESMRVRDGRLLLANFRCTKCHAPPSADAATAGMTAMPELAMDAPSFDDIGKRLSPRWMAAWISNPRALRPGAHMPRLFATASGVAVDPRQATPLHFSHPWELRKILRKRPIRPRQNWAANCTRI